MYVIVANIGITPAEQPVVPVYDQSWRSSWGCRKPGLMLGTGPYLEQQLEACNQPSHSGDKVILGLP